MSEKLYELFKKNQAEYLSLFVEHILNNESRIKQLESSNMILRTCVDDNTGNFTKEHLNIMDLKKQIKQIETRQKANTEEHEFKTNMINELLKRTADNTESRAEMFLMITELRKDFDDLRNRLQTTFTGVDIATGKDKTVFSVVKPDSREPGLYVKSKDEIIAWLEDNGYEIDLNGCYDSKNVSFVVDMFDYCGKKIDSNTKNEEGQFVYNFYYWLPEWLEEVPAKSEENDRIIINKAVGIPMDNPGFIDEAAPVSQEVWDSLSLSKKSGEKLREAALKGINEAINEAKEKIHPPDEDSNIIGIMPFDIKEGESFLYNSFTGEITKPPLNDKRQPPDEPQEILTEDDPMKSPEKIKNICIRSECENCIFSRLCRYYWSEAPGNWKL